VTTHSYGVSLFFNNAGASQTSEPIFTQDDYRYRQGFAKEVLFADIATLQNLA